MMQDNEGEVGKGHSRRSFLKRTTAVAAITLAPPALVKAADICRAPAALM